LLNRIACTAAVIAELAFRVPQAVVETPRREDDTVRCPILHTTLQIDGRLRPAVHAVWHRSPTFRRQVTRLSQEAVDAALNGWSAPLDSQAQAETAVRHAGGGRLSATVRIKLPNDEPTIAELIGHELEHIIEQLDGVDLSRVALRSARSSGVRVTGGKFETERARRVGMTVREEYLGHRSAASCVEAAR
jgi:hypothetical protein